MVVMYRICVTQESLFTHIWKWKSYFNTELKTCNILLQAEHGCENKTKCLLPSSVQFIDKQPFVTSWLGVRLEACGDYSLGMSKAEEEVPQSHSSLLGSVLVVSESSGLRSK